MSMNKKISITKLNTVTSVYEYIKHTLPVPAISLTKYTQYSMLNVISTRTAERMARTYLFQFLI